MYAIFIGNGSVKVLKLVKSRKEDKLNRANTFIQPLISIVLEALEIISGLIIIGLH